jgi:PAS domain S-box-containing protein
MKTKPNGPEASAPAARPAPLNLQGRRLRRISATNGALLIAAAAYLVFGSLSAWVISWRTVSDAEASALEELRGTVSAATSDKLFDPGKRQFDHFTDLDALQGFARGVGSSSVLNTRVLNFDGSLAYAADPYRTTDLDETAIASALSGSVADRRPTDGPVMQFYLPIKFGGVAVHGVVVMDYDWRPVLARAANLRTWVWVGTLLSVLTIAGTLWYAFRLFNRELRRRHRALSTIFDYAPIGIYTLTQDGTIDSFNPKMTELAGAKSPMSVIGLNVFKMASYQKAGLTEAFRGGLAGQPFEREIEYRSESADKTSWRHYQGIPIYQADGRTMERLLLLVEDITRQKQLEAKNAEYAHQLEQWAWDRTRRLVQTKERLENIIARVPIIVWSVDADGIFTLSQGSALQGIGWRENEAVGQSVFEVYRDHQEIIEALRQALAGEDVTFDSVIHDRHIQSYASPAKDKDQKVVGVNGISLDVTDRVRVEQRFKAMALNSADMTALIDQSGTVLDVVGQTTGTLGYESKELMNRPLADVIHPKDYPLLQQNLAKMVAAPQQSLTTTFRVRHKDGHWVHLESIGQSHLANPLIGAIVLNSRDISARIDAEAELRHRVATEQAMSNISAAAATSDDLAETIRAALIELGGSSAASHAFYVNLLDTDGPADEHSVMEWHEAEAQPIAATVARLAAVSTLWRDQLRAGSSLCLPVIADIPASDPAAAVLQGAGLQGGLVAKPVVVAGVPIAVLGMAVPANSSESLCGSRVLSLACEVLSSAVQRNRAFESANAQAKQQATLAALGQSVIVLGDAKRLSETVLETLQQILRPDIIGLYRHDSDTDGFRLYHGIGWNAQTAGTADRGDQQVELPGGVNSQAGFTMLAGQTVTVEDYAADRRFTLSKALHDTGARSGISTQIGTSQKTWGVLSLHYRRPHKFTPSEIGFTEAVAHLLSLGIEKIESDQRVHDLDQLKSKFIQVVSHQFRTPLSAARWNLESMLSGDAGAVSPEMRQLLRITYEANTEVISRIRDLLTVLDIEERRISINPEPVSLESLVGSVVTEFQRRADLKRIKLTATYPDEQLPAMQLDQEKIRTAIEKLMDNALTYTPADGSIEAKVSADDRLATVAVTDTGIGIPAQERHRVYERFYRASNATIAKPDASGLGLTIAKNLVEQHGGHITFDSVEGQGSTFRIELPMASA